VLTRPSYCRGPKPPDLCNTGECGRMGISSRTVLSLALTLSFFTVPVWANQPAKYSRLAESCSLPHPPQTSVMLNGAHALVDFSPDGDGQKLILQAIADAKRTILVQAYSFTDRRIITALGQAKARGVEVRVILDKSDAQPYQGHTPMAAVISAERIPVWIDSSVRIAHNKVMIIDGGELITGSYNFTYAADYDNAENLLLIRDAPGLVDAYISNWKWRQSCSQPYRGEPGN
jgi:phosphatidylserine/phosphatidylglycerophosphate/cardiolipin synthase-like enzyme